MTESQGFANPLEDLYGKLALHAASYLANI